MNFEVTRQQMRRLAYSTLEEKIAFFKKVTAADLAKFDAKFENWAHRNQLPPPENGWRNWLMMAGRGFGKTRAGAEWIEGLARSRPGVRIAVVGATIDEARRIYAVSPDFDMGLKYRYFSVGSERFDATGPTGPFRIHGRWHSHPLLASLIYNFSAPPPPPPPAPERG